MVPRYTTMMPCLGKTEANMSDVGVMARCEAAKYICIFIKQGKGSLKSSLFGPNKKQNKEVHIKLQHTEP